MIEPISFPEIAHNAPELDLAIKVNELVDASNRQDRAIVFLLANHPEVMEHMHRYSPLKEDAEFWQEEVTRRG